MEGHKEGKLRRKDAKKEILERNVGVVKSATEKKN
jgi:hypothetical protein